MTNTEIQTDETLLTEAAQQVSKLNLNKTVRGILGSILGLLTGALVFITVAKPGNLVEDK